MGLDHITQKYHSGHKALDIVSYENWERDRGYGEPECAPEDVEILAYTGEGYTPGNTDNLEHGYGIFMKGLETGYSYLYWHTWPYFPVNVGDIVKRGKIVAFMGNAGTVRVGGKYVPLNKRTQAPNLGTHLHMEMYTKTWKLGKKKTFVDPLKHIDFSLEPIYNQFDLLKAFSIILSKVIRNTQ